MLPIACTELATELVHRAWKRCLARLERTSSCVIGAYGDAGHFDAVCRALFSRAAASRFPIGPRVSCFMLMWTSPGRG